MDTFEGGNADPATLHKYLYTHGDPINGIDPSGLVSLSEVFIVADIIGVLASVKFAGQHLLAGEYKAAALDVVFIAFWGAAGARKTSAWGKWWLANRKIRAAYLRGVKEIRNIVSSGKAAGKSVKEIAEAAVGIRNTAKVAAREFMDPGDVAKLAQRNKEKYGDPIGPTIEWLFEKNGSYQAIIDSSLRTSNFYNFIFLVF